MTNLRTRPLAQVLSLALLLAGTQAHAQSPIYQTQSYSGLANGVPGPLTFDTFDLSTGNTLTRVEVSLNGTTFTGWAQGTKTGTSPADLYVNLIGNLNVSAPEIDFTVGLIDSQHNGQKGVMPGDTAGPYSYVDVPAKLVTGIPTQTLSFDTSDLRDYTSANGPTITITVTPDGVGVSGQAYDASDGTDVSADFSGSSTFAGDVSLTYTYTTPVPEPATTAAWMIGFAMCLLVGRRCYIRR